LTIEYDVPLLGKTKVTLEVQQHLGGNWVRTVAMWPTPSRASKKSSMASMTRSTRATST
jgi:F0F1-type ATP synthase beta subunit